MALLPFHVRCSRRAKLSATAVEEEETAVGSGAIGPSSSIPANPPPLPPIKFIIIIADEEEGDIPPFMFGVPGLCSCC